MGKLLIIDGHNLLFQMFYGMPARIVNQNGKAIHGIIGFIGALNKIIAMIKPTHLLVLFDSEKPNERKELLDTYKANRIDYANVPDKDNPFSQLDDIYRALDLMDIRYSEVSEYEVDDVIASYCFQYGQTLANTIDLIISSFDSDFFQLINDHIKIIRYRGKQSIIWDEEKMINKLMITPKQYVDYKALVGDSADNIKGIKGIGPKKASKLINTFGDLSTIFSRINEIDDPRLKEMLVNNQELVFLNQSLITLQKNLSLPFTLEELTYHHQNLKTMEIIKMISL